jgi:hypothetical protein
MAQTERQTRPKKGDRRAICLSNQIGNRDSSESLQPVRLHLITRKKISPCAFRRTAQPYFKSGATRCREWTQIANERDRNLCKMSPAAQATA